jgi:hypothetical protein
MYLKREYNNIFYQRRLSGPQHVNSALCGRSWKPNKLKNIFFTAVEIVPFEVERNSRLIPVQC